MGIKNNIESFDNNQLLARYILSFTVFISHSLYIYGKVEPSFYEGGHSLGWYAVNGFFFISGVLIAHSFQRRNFIEYISARVLRLFPAFILSLVVSIIAVVIFDKVNINSTFIISAAKFIFGNIVPIQEIKGGGISGIWSNGAAPGVLNTSLWTIPFEFFCYIFIVPLALSGKKYPFSRVLIGIVGIYFLSNLGVISGDGIIRYDFLRVFAYFLLGVGFYKCIFNKDGAIVIVLGLILILFFEGDFLEFGISLSLVLLIAFFGFSKKNFIKKWSSFDLSYGMYVYAWPVSQITANMNNSIYIKLIVATGFLILLSYFSFNYIEKPLLKKKKFFKEIKINGV